MIETDERYYAGFEGEPEIVFIISENGTEYQRFGFWDGYFDDMLREVKPAAEGWTGIAYYYHVGMFADAHWCKDQPWQIDDLPLVLHQLQAIACNRFEWQETANVLNQLIALMKDAMEHKRAVSVYCD